MTLGVGQRQTLFAAAYDRQGNLITNARFTFWSSDTLIAKVGREGAVVGVSPGLAKVEARVQGRQASLAILVTGPAPAADPGAASSGMVLSLQPGSAALLPGESLVLQSRLSRDDGTPVPPGRVTWKSLQPEIAAVDSIGLVIAVAPGRAVIQATASGGAMATAPIEVAALPLALSRTRLTLGPQEADTLRVLVPGQANREVRNGIQWGSTDTTVARVSAAGIVSGVSPGRADIVAAGFGQEGRAAVLVHREASTLVVTPPSSAGPIQLPVRGVRQVLLL
jgi:uncharacterized protein YjdB